MGTVTLCNGLIMKPCGKCGAPIGNQDDFCDQCRTTVAAQKYPAINEPLTTQTVQDSGNEPLSLKIVLFFGSFALRSIFIVPGVSIGCWLVLGNGIPIHQSASVGLGIAAAFSAFDVLMHCLNKTDSDTIG